MTTTPLSSGLQRLTNNMDAVALLGVVFIIGMIIITLPKPI
ncbi:MAG: hypothetical protein NZ518_10260 [Dehalococcoidia bacterium]|nr:hypothetical protein [Dehalococcoidia bacterium]